MPLPIRSEETGFGLFPSLQNQFSRLQRQMDEMFSSLSPTREEEGVWTPTVDVYEDDKEIRVKADLPGIEAKDIDINIENGVLTIYGKREESKEENKENYHRRERFFGEFRRSFTLPDYAETEQVDANFKNGELEVKIPVKAESKRQPKRIEVKS